MKRAACTICLFALLGALPAAAQVDFSNYVALGDSLTAGYVSSGLTEFYQERSYPAMLAQQAGTPDFQMPLVTEPGIPPLLALHSLVPGPVIAPSASEYGTPTNVTLARPYNNLGVPGATLVDMMETRGDYCNLLPPDSWPAFPDCADPALVLPANGMYDIVLRFRDFSAIEQAIGLDPSFVTMWIGNNDVLGAAAYATPVEGLTLTPVDTFASFYQSALGALTTMTTADIVVVNIPSVTDLPFVTTIKPYLDVPGVGQVPLIGTNGPLTPDSYVTLNASALLAQGIGVPVELGGTGLPLPDDLVAHAAGVDPGVVLRPDEVAAIEDRIAAFNTVIRETANALGVPMLDANSVFGSIVGGNHPDFGGIELNAGLLTGGLFSYDGVHPQNIGYAIVAMELIDLINDEFGATIPQVDMNQVLCVGGCAGHGPPAGGPSKDAIYSDAAVRQILDAFPLVERSQTRSATGQ